MIPRMRSYIGRLLAGLAAAAFCGALPLGAEPSFDPDTPILLRPFGDSITYGLGNLSGGGYCPTFYPYKGCNIAQKSGGGYRAFLTGAAVGTGKTQFRTEGSQLGNSNLTQWATGSSAHDGYPGFRTDQLRPISQVLSFADATLVHAGTNDMLQSKPVDTAFNYLTEIVGNLLKKNQGGHIFVARIIPVTDAAATFLASKELQKLCKCPATTPAKVNAAITAYNQRISADLIDQLKPAQPSAAERVTIVDMSALLNSASDYSDGVHPNIRGYCKMSYKWTVSIYPALKPPPSPNGIPAPPPTPCDFFSVAQLESMQEGRFPALDDEASAWPIQPPPGYSPPPGGGPMSFETFMRMMSQPKNGNPGRVRERTRKR